MKQNEFGQWEFLQLIWQNESYIDMSTLVAFSGEKKSTLMRKIKRLKEVPFVKYKNRFLIRTDYALKIHQHMREQGL